MLLTALLMELPLLGQMAPSPPAASVEGEVVNSITDVGIPGATVRFVFRNEYYQTVTDGSGAFQFAGIKPGDYVVSAQKPSFTAPRSRALSPRPVHIGPEKVHVHLDLIPPAMLRGRVFGIDGKPAAGAKVDLGRGILVNTSDDGSFVFEKCRAPLVHAGGTPRGTEGRFPPRRRADGDSSHVFSIRA
jgi:hypothetical protein